MNHPYSGHASYIYANERLAQDSYNQLSPYEHMRSFVPHLSVETLPLDWLPDISRALVPETEPRLERMQGWRQKFHFVSTARRRFRLALRRIRRMLYLDSIQ